MAIVALGEQVLAYCQAYLPHSDFRHPVPRWTGVSSFRIQVQLEWVQLSVSDLVDILCMSSFQCQKLKENCAKKRVPFLQFWQFRFLYDVIYHNKT